MTFRRKRRVSETLVIEVFFRTAKQDLGFEQCHSASQAHQLYAPTDLLFATETLLAFALWQLSKKNE